MSHRAPRESDLSHVLAHTRDLWQALRGQRVFMTGATGFVGRWLIETFVNAHDQLHLDTEVIVLTRQPSVFRSAAPDLAGHPAVRIVEGDVRSFSFPEDKCHCVVHAAASLTARTPAERRELIDITVNGTRRVLEFARHAGVAKMLYVSSGAVYGPQPAATSRLSEAFQGGPILAAPASAYAEAKRIAELMCLVDGEETACDMKIARGFAFAGPHLPLDGPFAIGNFVRDALAGVPVRVYGDGRARRSYLYGADMAIWLWTILVRGEPGRAYNVGSEADISMSDLAQLVASVILPGLPVIIEAAPDVAPAARYVPDTRRAHEELGLDVWIDLTESITRTAAWHQFHAARGAAPS